MFKTKHGFGFLCYLLFFCVPSMFIIALGGQDQQQAFNEAWQKFVDGDFISSEALVDNQLDGKIDSRHLQANFLYLKAYLQGKRSGLHFEATTNFQRAQSFYMEQGFQEGVYCTDLGLAKIFLDEGHNEEAKARLFNCLNLAKQYDFPMGYIYALLAESATQEGNYERALQYARQSEGAYKAFKDQTGMANALCQQGFLQLTLGQWQLGYETSLRAQAQIVKAGAPYLHVYTLANMALYYSYNDMDISPLVTPIERAIEGNRDENLTQILDFVLGIIAKPTQTSSLNDPPRPPLPPLPIPGPD